MTSTASQVFSLAGKALKLTSKEDIQPHLDTLDKMEFCSKIDLSGNTLGVEASKALATYIKDHKSLYQSITEINFADLYTSRLVEEVLESLKQLLPVLLLLENLETLDLSDNAFGLRTICSLENYIANAITLKHFYLNNNGLGPHAGERIGKALFVLSQNKKNGNIPYKLNSFVCGRNRLENGSALFLALGLKSHGKDLTKVALPQNGIRPKGICTLIHYGLRYLSNLQVLDLQDNTFTKYASMELSRTLPNWENSLEILNLNDCLLKNEGGRAILDVFESTTFKNLKDLKLEYNEINQSTLEESLIPILKDDRLPKLEILEINGNRFEEDSDAIDYLQSKFDTLEIDDLEELDSDEEDEEEEEIEDEEEQMEEAETEVLEKELFDSQLDDLTNELAKSSI